MYVKRGKWNKYIRMFIAYYSVPPKPFDGPAGRSKRQFDLPAEGQIDSAAAQNDLQNVLCPIKIESNTIYMGWGNGFPFN